MKVDVFFVICREAEFMVDQNQTTDLDYKDQIENLTKQVESLTNQWKRAVADYQNLQKRVEKEMEDWAKFANLRLLERLIPVLDNLERAREHLTDPGLDIVHRDLIDILLDQGLKEIEVKVGDIFDPNLHECVETVATGESERIVTVVGRGYIMGERVIRPVKVKVGKRESDSELSPSADKPDAKED